MSVATLPSEPPEAPARRERRLQRADGRARLRFAAAGDGATRLAGLYQRSPCRALFPRAERAVPEAVLLNTAGGVAGGDRVAYEVAAGTDARVVVTTQAAERIYRSLALDSRIDNRIRLAAGAALDWLPQETIVFDGARLKRCTEIELAGDARLLALDWLVLGRRASGERVTDGAVHDRWRLRRDGRLVWADDFRLAGDIEALTGHPALLGGASALATLLYAGADAGQRLEQVRAALAGCAGRSGATVLDGVLLCRFLADDAQRLRADVSRILAVLRTAPDGTAVPLPRVWQV